VLTINSVNIILSRRETLNNPKSVETSLDQIMDALIHIPPIFAKKLLKMDPSGFEPGLTRLHFTIMGVLSQGNLPVSELARALLITKPQMTHLVDHLVKMDVIERQPDSKDRRVINLALTEKGKVMRDSFRQKIEENIKEALAGLTPEELASMADALDTLRNIGSKL
jgi:DNA-binding MarR family transcriptional regulator